MISCNLFYVNKFQRIPLNLLAQSHSLLMIALVPGRCWWWWWFFCPGACILVTIVLTSTVWLRVSAKKMFDITRLYGTCYPELFTLKCSPYPELRYLLYVIGKMFSFPYAEIWLLTLLKAEGRQIFKQTSSSDVTYPVGATSLPGPSINRTPLECGILFYLFFFFFM